MKEPVRDLRRLLSARSVMRVLVGVGAVGLLLLPVLLPSHLQTIATRILIFSLFAISLDIVWGYTGLFSLGHAAFLGVGGYATGLLIVRYGEDGLWAGLMLGTVLAVITGAVFGFIALRLAGAYFLLVTLALGQLGTALASRWSFLSTSSGTEGIFGISLPDLGVPLVTLSSNREYYWLVLGIVGTSFLLLRGFVRSPLGIALQGVRQNEPRMRALGFNTWGYRYLAFLVGAGFAGMAGVLLAYHDGFVVPDNFGIEMSTIVLLMVLIGGPGTLYGPVVGAAFLITLELIVSGFLPERWPLILGGTYVLAVIFARGGIVRRLVTAQEDRDRRQDVPKAVQDDGT